MLNIGCGKLFHREWLNIDSHTNREGVLLHDVRKGLPFSDHAFDVCYSSHLLEHLTRDEGDYLLFEIYRVLKPGGLVRLVVPDLQDVVNGYLKSLTDCERGVPHCDANHEWMVMELYDQAVRICTGGEIGKLLKGKDLPNKDFILSRIGPEWESIRNQEDQRIQISGELLNVKKLRGLLKTLRYALASLLVGLVAGKEGAKGFKEGIFRNSGEVHLWMYDKHSLKRLLIRRGFRSFRVCDFNESAIPEFGKYHLDEISGKPRKPASIYVEALK